eukprot:5258990-Prymnesium_polylepis.2
MAATQPPMKPSHVFLGDTLISCGARAAAATGSCASPTPQHAAAKLSTPQHAAAKLLGLGAGAAAPDAARARPALAPRARPDL